jgi:hypothetical protein
MSRMVALLAASLLGACGGPDPAAAPGARNDHPAASTDNRLVRAPVEPAPPGTSGGLPDDRTPVPEAPFAENSAQGAAQVVQSYFALLEAGRFAEARRFWSDGAAAGGRSETAFAASYRAWPEVHAQVGAPGDIEGAAGSLYVEVPVQVYGRTAAGEAFNRRGTVTLRRVNDVPGSTAEQRRWHIARSDVEPGG